MKFTRSGFDLVRAQFGSVLLNLRTKTNHSCCVASIQLQILQKINNKLSIKSQKKIELQLEYSEDSLGWFYINLKEPAPFTLTQTCVKINSRPISVCRSGPIQLAHKTWHIFLKSMLRSVHFTNFRESTRMGANSWTGQRLSCPLKALIDSKYSES